MGSSRRVDQAVEDLAVTLIKHSVGKVSHRITVVIPTIPPRKSLLERAIRSVERQTYPAAAIVVAEDTARQGAGATRNRALFAARTKWVAFLDDDDVLYPEHLERLVAHQMETGADVVWPWFKTVGGGDPIACHFGRQWDPTRPHQFPITALVRRMAAVKVGGFPEGHAVSPRCAGEDYPFWIAVSNTGAKFAHLPERTWEYRMDHPNTSGLPTRW